MLNGDGIDSRRGAVALGLIRVAKAIDSELRGALAVRHEQSPLSQDAIDAALVFEPGISSQVADFISDTLGTDGLDAVDTLLPVRIQLSQLHRSVAALGAAVQWANQYTAIAWWLREHQRYLHLGEYTVLLAPAPIGEFEIESGSVVAEDLKRLHAHAVIPSAERNIAQLSKLRMLRAPAEDGAAPLWHPITLGHELAHLRYTQARAIRWLASRDASGRGELVGDAVALATGAGGKTVPPAWFQTLVQWLTEVACDTALGYHYGEEGIAALASHLTVHARQGDSASHPSPELRVAIQNASSEADLSRFRPTVPHRDETARRRSVFLALALECRQSVKEDLGQLGTFSPWYSDKVATVAAESLASHMTPASQTWDQATLINSPLSIETGLVKALWRQRTADSKSDGESLQTFPAYDEAWSATQERIDHAVDSLQFASRFEQQRRRLKIQRSDRIANVLWVTRTGVRLSEDEGEQGVPAFDVRLGRHFIVFKRNEIVSLDALAESRRVRGTQGPVEVGWGQPFVLHPGELVLAVTLESVQVAKDCSAQVLSRSSLGRMGLLSATAVQVHPGFRGCLTLELVNLASVPLNLSPGQRIAQIVPAQAVGATAYEGHYQDAGHRPRFSAADSDWEMGILRGLRKD